MKTSLSAVGALCLVSPMDVVAAEKSVNETIIYRKEKQMNYVTTNGVQMPQLGFGTWTLKGDVAASSVLEAMKIGYRLIDSAQAYGNEAEVWRGIQESKVKREDVFITTKISPDNMRNGKVRESLEQSLTAFGDNYLDLVLIHWPVKGKVEETWKIMEKFVEQGKVRAIGLSNFNPHHVDELQEYAKIKPIINQIEIHPYMTQWEVAGYTFRKGIQVQSWSPLGTGSVLNDDTLLALGQKYGKSAAQIVIRWHLQRGNVVIPRSQNKTHIAENFAVFDFELSPVDMSIVNGLNRNKRVNSKNDPETFPW